MPTPKDREGSYTYSSYRMGGFLRLLLLKSGRVLTPTPKE